MLPLVAYMLVTLAGATTSSLGLLRAASKTPVPRELGTPQQIRMDEWLSATPLEAGTLVHGSIMHSPLSQAPNLIYQISSGGFFETILFAEGNLLRLGPWLPDAMMFAAFRAFPWLLLFLTLPPLLRRLGANRPMSWLATVMCFLAPASLWWSFWPVRILAFAAAGCYLLFLARDQVARSRWVSGALLSALAGLCLARLVTFYVPWSLTVAVPLVIATGVFLLRGRLDRRSALAALGMGAGVGLVVLGGVVWENWAAIQAELNTVYPGQRRTTGTPLSPFQLFWAPGEWDLESDPAPPLLNQSEITSAFLFCGVWAAVLWPTARRVVSERQRVAVIALAVGLVVTASWAMVTWGSMGFHVPLLNTLLPNRAAQTVGYPATLLLALVLSRLEHGSWRTALTAAAACAAVTAYGVSDLQRTMPHLSAVEVWVSIVVTTGLVLAITRWPRRAAPVLATTVVLAIAAVGSNPVILGLGDLRGTPASARALTFARDAEQRGGLWAADSTIATALLVANGVPTLSGYQVTGPDVAQWEKLDPDHSDEEIWNRGASYIIMHFKLPADAPPGGDPVITLAAPDAVLVEVDPCWLAESDFGVTHVLSVGGLRSPCARPTSEVVPWAGRKQRVYAITPASG